MGEFRGTLDCIYDLYGDAWECTVTDKKTNKTIKFFDDGDLTINGEPNTYETIKKYNGKEVTIDYFSDYDIKFVDTDMVENIAQAANKIIDILSQFDKETQNEILDIVWDEL